MPRCLDHISQQYILYSFCDLLVQFMVLVWFFLLLQNKCFAYFLPITNCCSFRTLTFFSILLLFSIFNYILVSFWTNFWYFLVVEAILYLYYLDSCFLFQSCILYWRRVGKAQNFHQYPMLRIFSSFLALIGRGLYTLRIRCWDKCLIPDMYYIWKFFDWLKEIKKLFYL